MGFVAAFYSFIIELADQDRGVFENIKQKLARHPEESEGYLVARLLAYLHAYTPELSVTGGMFEPDQPTLLRRNARDEVVQWIHVGSLSEKTLHYSLRHNRNSSFAVYFLSEDEQRNFAEHLKGSTTNWISNISFWRFDHAALEELAATLTSSNRWSATVIDGSWYVSVGERQIQFSFQQIDMWQQFQDLLQASEQHGTKNT